MNKKRTPTKLATPNHLSEKGHQEIAASLNPLVADALALYLKSKNFHWHVSGSHFRDYHLLFDEQADQIFAMIDPLAERVRKLGGITIRSIEEVGRLQRVKDSTADFVEPEKMVRELMNENKEFAENLLAAHKVCEKHGDVATCSVLEIFIDETQRRLWFLFETSSGL
ncbi:MAG TPA: DNA starvation/stationary phase protection protein [Chlamydiales bacterium]|jgi:starvation-inducible DNA-binding protein|nr:DNA starvation/stationary phase protection protein [Chlamydiales bacterium]